MSPSDMPRPEESGTGSEEQALHLPAIDMSTRVLQTASLEDPVTTLKSIKEGRAAKLARLDIYTVRDLLEHYPRRYIDLTHIARIEESGLGQTVTVVGTVDEVRERSVRRGMRIVEASVIDDTGCLMVTWFNQPWLARQIHKGDTVSVSGKMTFSYGYRRMSAPILQVLDAGEGADVASVARVIPVHPLTADISAAMMRRFVESALEKSGSVLDPLPPDLRLRFRLLPRHAAWRQIHEPENMDQVVSARRRLAFEELFVMQCHLRRTRMLDAEGSRPIAHIVDGPAVRGLFAALPFNLTADQESARAAILGDMARASRMNRMLLGDVGTGKTAVAAFALAAVHDSNTQAAMMAPTSVLATQYAVKLGPLLDSAGVTWELLTGATPKRRRADICSRLAHGEIDVMFGTNVLLSPDVAFRHLTLAVIDEQHRFGVSQRKALHEKGPGCDSLLMTATPIPRTLALMFFGDLECTYLKDRPANRAPVRTSVLSPSNIAQAYDAVRLEVSKGRQAYVVCPLVGTGKAEDDEERMRSGTRLAMGEDLSDPRAATARAAFLAEKVFPDFEVGLLTGRMRSEEKIDVMDRFRSGAIQVLVATTVIEVGVDVPNATVMVIDGADCFGLSQLHQLRGRVGRGDEPGQVFLVADTTDEVVDERMRILSTTDDGFELASCDLAMRHEGDVLGSRQSGRSTLSLVDVTRDGRLIEVAHAEAVRLLDKDPGLAAPEHRLLAFEVERLSRRMETGGEA